MINDHSARGGATVAVLNRMEAWEANLVLNLRLWCEGPRGQDQVWNEYRAALPETVAQDAFRSFEALVKTLIEKAHRPLVRHEVGCACVGADEAVFVNLVRTASDGYLNDASLIATLMVGPSHAEHIALLAGETGVTSRTLHDAIQTSLTELGHNVVRLH